MKFMQIEPQPARGVLRESMWTDPNWIAEEKYDGDRRIAQFCGKVVRFTGRRISVKDGLYVEKTENVPHLAGTYSVDRKSCPPPHPPPPDLNGTVLDGEMIVDSPLHGKAFSNGHEGRSKWVTSIMGSLPEEAVRKQIERGWLRYVVFDCLWFEGQDLRGAPLDRRQQYADRAVEAWGNPFVSLAVQTRHGDKRRFYEKIVAAGGEGVILKYGQHIYGSKTGWVKVKRQATADVVIMGFKDPKEMSIKKGEDRATLTKYAKDGLIGAILCGQYPPKGSLGGSLNELVEVATVSGMDDRLRRTLTYDAKKYIGMVIEIEHNGREPTGRFRHPRFNRFRDDKRAIDCVMREEES